MTLTVDTEQLQELRRLVGARSMSSAVEIALAEYLDKIRHFAAVDEWLSEMEREDGPIPPETLAWAEQVFRDWESGGGSPRKRTPRQRRQVG